MRIASTFLFFFLFISMSQAQRMDSRRAKVDEGLLFPKYRLGVSPSALASRNPTFQISNDFGITSRLNMSLETGFIFSSYDWGDYGFKTRTGLEYRLSQRDSRFFAVGVSYVYEDLTENRFGEDVLDQFGYIEEVSYKKNKTTKGIVFSITTAEQLSERLRMEFGIGYGAGKYIVSNSDNFRDPEDSDFERPVEFDEPGEFDRAIIYFNLNFSYTILE